MPIYSSDLLLHVLTILCAITHGVIELVLFFFVV